MLNGAKVVTLIDMAASWPGPGGLAMGGFVYENLVPYEPFPLGRRLEWVASATPEYSPEPYERLATVLRNSGEDADAREVLLAKQRRRRETLPLAAKLWGYLQDWTVAYGYRPGRAALWMAVLWAAGAVAFAQADRRRSSATSIREWNAALYALDLLVPVINLGQDGYWRLRRRLAVGRGRADPARLDPRDDGRGGRLPSAAAAEWPLSLRSLGFRQDNHSRRYESFTATSGAPPTCGFQWSTPCHCSAP